MLYEYYGCLSLYFILIVIKCAINERTVTLGVGINFWEFCRSPKAQNNRLVSCGRKKIMKTRGGLCNT